MKEGANSHKKEGSWIGQAMNNDEAWDSVRVGLNREELLRIFSAMAKEDAENEELARATHELRQEIRAKWEEDMNGDDIEVAEDVATAAREFYGFLKELAECLEIDSYSQFKLLQRIRKYGCYLPREQSFKLFFTTGSHAYLLKLLNSADFTSDTIRVTEALRLLKKLVRYAEELKSADEGQHLMGDMKHQGVVETLMRVMKRHGDKSYEIQKRAVHILFKFFWRKVHHQKHLHTYVNMAGEASEWGVVNSDVRRAITQEGGMVDLLYRIEGFPEYFSIQTIQKALAMRQEFPKSERLVAISEGRGNSRLAEPEASYWDRRGGMNRSEYFKKRQSEGVPRRQRDWDLSSDISESEDEGPDRRRKSGTRRGSEGGEIHTYHSFDTYRREDSGADKESGSEGGGKGFVYSSGPGGDLLAYGHGQQDPFKKLMEEDIFARRKEPGTSTRSEGHATAQSDGYVGAGGSTATRPVFSATYKAAFAEDPDETRRLLPHRRKSPSSGSVERIGINNKEHKPNDNSPSCSCKGCTLF